MQRRDVVEGLRRRLREVLRLSPSFPDFGSLSISIDQARAQADRTGLADVFFDHRGRKIHKWIHYLTVYERYLEDYRDTNVKMLEIGVSKGGSLEMWREYFGPAATIYGVDIDPACASHVSPTNQVRIGSQDDPDFLRRVVDEMGSPDIVLDDGSHIGRHQRVSFDVLFPLLKEAGLYIIEDMHTAYWPGPYEGGHCRKGTAIEHVKEMIDDLHAWYHNRATTTPARDQIGAIHIFDSITIIEKVAAKPRPAHTIVPD